jgi:two-component system, OmpR family, alkaline phosphatase synthesis response regulator PhoP
MNPYLVLVVDDDEDLCEILRFNLINEGYQVDIAYSAEEAMQKNLQDYHLIVLDVLLGEMSGFRMAHSMRNDPTTATTPIIFLTARDSENDRLTGFNLGADDYITKPFSVRELMARVHAVIYRINRKKISIIQMISYDRLNMNLTNKQVILEGEEIRFTKKEFEILKLLIENKNRLFTREELLARVWKEEAFVLSRTIDVNITRIRKKIGSYEKNIVTKLGRGYCFEG